MNNGKICISICAPTLAGMRERVELARQDCDLVELRLDCLDDLNSNDVTRLAEDVILTLRPRKEGGHRDSSRDDRIQFWSQISAGFGADLEEDVISEIDASKFHPLIASFHDHIGTPDVAAIYHRLSDTGADVIKIAVTANDITETVQTWKLMLRAQQDGKSIIPIAMGETGKWTRILGLAHGAYLTYASLDSGGETAPGQITARDMIDVYRVKELDEQTEVYGIIAGDTSYSMSPYLHNAAFNAVGLNAVFVPLQVQDLDAFMQRMVLPATREVDLNFRGFSVTNPHKEAIIRYLDHLDDSASKIGAVNTVKIKDGKLIGFNTDAKGFITPLADKFGDVKSIKATVVGAGGVARACIYSLKNAGADVTIFARSVEKARELAEEFGLGSGQLLSESPELTNFDIVVNATPLGTRGKDENETIATAEQLRGVKLVYDLVYNPSETRLMREARQAAADTINGFDMLVAQAVEQFKIWTGLEPPINEMAVAARNKLDEY